MESMYVAVGKNEILRNGDLFTQRMKRNNKYRKENIFRDFHWASVQMDHPDFNIGFVNNLKYFS